MAVVVLVIAEPAAGQIKRRPAINSIHLHKAWLTHNTAPRPVRQPCPSSQQRLPAEKCVAGWLLGADCTSLP